MLVRDAGAWRVARGAWRVARGAWGMRPMPRAWRWSPCAKAVLWPESGHSPLRLHVAAAKTSRLWDYALPHSVALTLPASASDRVRRRVVLRIEWRREIRHVHRSPCCNDAKNEAHRRHSPHDVMGQLYRFRRCLLY